MAPFPISQDWVKRSYFLYAAIWAKSRINSLPISQLSPLFDIQCFMELYEFIDMAVNLVEASTHLIMNAAKAHSQFLVDKPNFWPQKTNTPCQRAERVPGIRSFPPLRHVRSLLSPLFLFAKLSPPNRLWANCSAGPALQIQSGGFSRPSLLYFGLGYRLIDIVSPLEVPRE